MKAHSLPASRPLRVSTPHPVPNFLLEWRSQNHVSQFLKRHELDQLDYINIVKNILTYPYIPFSVAGTAG